MAERGEQLFTLPIGSDGHVVVTQPAKQVYLVAFESGTDNRLTTVCVFTVFTSSGSQKKNMEVE